MLTGSHFHNCRLVGREQSAAILDLELQPKFGLPDPANHPPLLLLKLLPLFPLLSDEQGAEQRGAGDGEDHQQEAVPAAFEEPGQGHRAPGHFSLDSQHPGGPQGERAHVKHSFQVFVTLSKHLLSLALCSSISCSYTASPFERRRGKFRPLLIGDLGMPGV